MEKEITKKWYLILFKGIIMILLAILVLNHPGESLLSVAIYLGIGFLLTGVMIISLGLAEKNANPNWRWKTFEGISDFLLGLIVIAHPILILSLIPFLIGFWAALYGINLIIDAFSQKESLGLKLISGILIFILALVLMFNPLLMGLSMVIWFGILLLFNGVSNVIFSFSLK